MAKKKRLTFDIELPEEDPTPLATTTAKLSGDDDAPRRGPMASAIGENAVAVRERRAAEAAIRDENDRLAHELVRMKSLGLVTDLIPVDRIRSDKLVRDRYAVDDIALAELKLSIQETGLSNPIRVQEVGDGWYELIQGSRRLMAYRELLAESKDDRWAEIPAGLMPRDMEMDDLYRRMVDENLVRKDISFAEMAELARRYASDSTTRVSDTDEAVRVLFKSADYQRRSYIRAFVTLMDRIEAHLKFPEAISRNLGLALRKRLESTEGVMAGLVKALQTLGSDRSLEDELSVLRRFAQGGEEIEDLAPKAVIAAAAKPPKAARTVFRISRPAGEAKCTASQGRLELKGPEDFSAYDRKRLEDAVAAFYRVLEG